MKVPFFDLKEQYGSIRNELNDAIQSVLDSANFVGGSSVLDFEAIFSELLGMPHCVGVGNGTDALFVALKSFGVTTGDEVITPAFSWISSAETISMAGGRPVFADISEDWPTINIESVRSKITPRTRGLIVVHLYGQLAPVHEIKEICDKKGLFLLEDCAQAHLSRTRGRYAGTVGHAATFSFYPTKNLGAYGDAGCLITRDADLASRARLFANHGGLNVHQFEGINSRLDTLQAAILKVKSKYLPQWTAKRNSNAGLYHQWLSDIPEIKLPQSDQEDKPAYHHFVIRSNRRDALKTFLASRGIDTQIHYARALVDLPAYRNLGSATEEFPAARAWAGTVLSLPVYPELSENEIRYVCESIREFVKKA
jgi:dTDP-4-amino-4,6-dideoxygalactose transaminase